MRRLKFVPMAAALCLAVFTAGCTQTGGAEASSKAAETQPKVQASVFEAESSSAAAVGEGESTALNTDGDKVRVGISWASDTIDEDAQAYHDAVEKAGGEPVFLPQIITSEDAQAALQSVDALVMTGGEDIDPGYYGAEPDAQLGEINEERDISDALLLTAALEEDFPTLCTCRGMQLLNVLSGGSLYQDLPTQYESNLVHRDPELKNYAKHDIEVKNGSILEEAFGGVGGVREVNSWHHQAIDRLGDNLEVLATAPDGIIESVIRTDKSFMLGVQFHPEGLIEEGDEDALHFYTLLMEQARGDSKTEDVPVKAAA